MNPNMRKRPGMLPMPDFSNPLGPPPGGPFAPQLPPGAGLGVDPYPAPMAPPNATMPPLPMPAMDPGMAPDIGGSIPPGAPDPAIIAMQQAQMQGPPREGYLRNIGRGIQQNPGSPYAMAGGALGGALGTYLRTKRKGPGAGTTMYAAQGGLMGPVKAEEEHHCACQDKPPAKKMAMGGLAKERKGYPRTHAGPGKNSKPFPLATVHPGKGGEGGMKARGMGKATRGNRFHL